MLRGKAKIKRNIFRKGSALTRRINGILKANNMTYNYSPLLSRAYNGEGFYVDSVKLACNGPIKTYGYDIHWCYGGTLLHNKFPLSSRVSRKKKTELSILMYKFDEIKERYEDFTYTIYKNKIIEIENGKKVIILTNLDAEIFKDMYKIKNLELANQTYFQDVGEMPEELKKLATDCYYIKKQGITKPEKIVLESSFYGKFAQRVNKHRYGTYEQRKKYEEAFTATNYEDVRDARVPIAMFQSAHQRYREWQAFKKYKDVVLYMNTDSIMCEKEIDIETGNHIGDWGLEYNNDKIYFIRRNAYIVFNEDGSIKKKVLGGIPLPEENKFIKQLGFNHIGKEEVEKLMNGKAVDCVLIDDRSKTGLRRTTLSPLFFWLYN